MRRTTVIASAFAVSSLMPAMVEGAFAASDPTGVWLNDTGRGAIEIKPCGNALCGNVVWVKDQADAKGCGKQIIGNVAPVGGGRWDNGWIYSPERGRRYNVELTPLADGKLRVTGYAGLRFLSKTMIWTRAPADLQLCGQSGTQVEAKPGQPANATPDTKSTAAANVDTSPKATAKPEVALAAPPPQLTTPAPARAPNASSTMKPSNSDAPAAAATAPSTAAKDEDKSAKPQSAPPPPAAAAKEAAPDSAQNDEETASADNGGESDLEQKLNGLGLGKIFTKTKSGKCKVDLPWVKLSVDCND